MKTKQNISASNYTSFELIPHHDWSKIYFFVAKVNNVSFLNNLSSSNHKRTINIWLITAVNRVKAALLLGDHEWPLSPHDHLEESTMLIVSMTYCPYKLRYNSDYHLHQTMLILLHLLHFSSRFCSLPLFLSLSSSPLLPHPYCLPFTLMLVV